MLDGFPSRRGLVNAIASECLIRSIDTDLIAVVDSPEFPPVSIIENYIPQYPARIYVNEKLKVVFFDFRSKYGCLDRNGLTAIMTLKWALQNECRMTAASGNSDG